MSRQNSSFVKLVTFFYCHSHFFNPFPSFSLPLLFLAPFYSLFLPVPFLFSLFFFGLFLHIVIIPACFRDVFHRDHAFVTYIQRDQGSQIQFLLLEAVNIYHSKMLGGELKHFI